MIPTGVSMVVSGGAVSPENRSNEGGLRVGMDYLRARLAAVERERDALREDVKIRDAEITRQYGIILALDNDAEQALIDRDEAIEAESQAGDRIAARWAVAIAENARLLARIAAVEATLREFVDVRGDFYEFHPLAAMIERLAAAVGFALRSDWRSFLGVAALAASPTPERCGEFGIELWEMRCEYVPGGRHTHYPTRAASPTPTGAETETKR